MRGRARGTHKRGEGRVEGTLTNIEVASEERPEELLALDEALQQGGKGQFADVHALGVLLFELLSGRLSYPLLGKPMPEAVRILCDDEPPTLSSLDKSLVGDIDTMVAKAIAKEPEVGAAARSVAEGFALEKTTAEQTAVLESATK